jgi:hypothetical protein
MFSRSSRLRHSLSMGERAIFIGLRFVILSAGKRRFRWTNFQNCSFEVVPFVYTSVAENMSLGSVEGNLIAHSSPRWVAFWEVARLLLRTLSIVSPLTEMSADDGLPCTVLSELMGFEIGFMRSLYRAPFCYFLIEIALFFVSYGGGGVFRFHFSFW